MRCWQVSCQDLSGCCYTIGLDTCACPGYCYSKNITPFMVSQLLIAHRNNKLYTSLFWRVTPWRLGDMSRRFWAVFASIFRKVCGEESISEVRIPIGNHKNGDQQGRLVFFTLQCLVSLKVRAHWYHSKLLNKSPVSYTATTRYAYHTSCPASFTIQTCLMMIRHSLLSTSTFAIRILFHVSEARFCS